MTRSKNIANERDRDAERARREVNPPPDERLRPDERRELDPADVYGHLADRKRRGES